jgi:hypothetical protein
VGRARVTVGVGLEGEDRSSRCPSFAGIPLKKRITESVR